MATDASVDAVPCVGCGYDLRNLPVDGPCPECGRAIADSLGGRRLAAADQRWLTRLVIGQSMVTWGLQIALVSFCVLPMLGIVFGVLGVWSGPQVAVARVVIITLALTLLGGIGIVWLGALLVTTPDPSESGTEPPTSSRHIARWGLAASVVLAFLALLIGRLPVPLLLTLPVVAAEIVLPVLAVIAVTTGTLALLGCLVGRATRIPDPDLAARTRRIGRVLRWSLPSFLAPVVCAMSYSSLQAVFPALGGIAPILAMANLVAFAFFCVVLFQLARLSTAARQYRVAFRAARDEARVRGAPSGRVDADVGRAAGQVDTDTVADDDDGESVAR